jgi:hypothetical protein
MLPIISSVALVYIFLSAPAAIQPSAHFHEPL